MRRRKWISVRVTCLLFCFNTSSVGSVTRVGKKQKGDPLSNHRKFSWPYRIPLNEALSCSVSTKFRWTTRSLLGNGCSSMSSLFMGLLSDWWRGPTRLQNTNLFWETQHQSSQRWCQARSHFGLQFCFGRIPKQDIHVASLSSCTQSPPRVPDLVFLSFFFFGMGNPYLLVLIGTDIHNHRLPFIPFPRLLLHHEQQQENVSQIHNTIRSHRTEDENEDEIERW